LNLHAVTSLWIAAPAASHSGPKRPRLKFYSLTSNGYIINYLQHIRNGF
jgi:hypothetical protein